MKKVINNTVNRTRKQVESTKERYTSPTPIKLKIFGDGLLLVSGIAALLIPGAKWVIALGLAGKYFTDLGRDLTYIKKE